MRNLLWSGAVAILVGIFFIVVSYFLNDQRSSHYHPLTSYLLANFGALLIFTAGYTFISEFYLKRDFIQQLAVSLDDKLRTAKLHESILRSGLSEVCDRFNDERLLERMGQASNVRMLVM